MNETPGLRGTGAGTESERLFAAGTRGCEFSWRPLRFTPIGRIPFNSSQAGVSNPRLDGSIVGLTTLSGLTTGLREIGGNVSGRGCPRIFTLECGWSGAGA